MAGCVAENNVVPVKLSGKYLTFRLGEEAFGLGILTVQEIIGVMPITRVPKTPHFVRGVVNLRGKVIPVIDLRLKFGMDFHDDTERTCIIVVQVASGDGDVTVGLIVDEVSEVVDVKDDQIEPAPSFGASVDTTILLGLGKIGGRVIMLLDVDQALSYSEIQALETAQ